MRLRKGYLLKSILCKKLGLKYRELDNKLIEEGYLVRRLVSTGLIYGDKKYCLSPTLKGKKYIKKHTKSNAQPPYQYNERFFIKLFKND